MPKNKKQTALLLKAFQGITLGEIQIHKGTQIVKLLQQL